MFPRLVPLLFASLVACSGDPSSSSAAPHDHAAAHNVGSASAAVSGGGHDHAASTAAVEQWTCPMHPDVHAAASGACPTCGMDLVQQAPAASGGGGHMARMETAKSALQARLGAAYDAPVVGLADADPGRGEALFAASCAGCHGAGGAGDGVAGAGLDPSPADLTDPAHARFYSDAGRVEIIRGGMPLNGSPMVGFGERWEPQQVLDVYAYVRSLRGADPGAHGGAGHHH